MCAENYNDSYILRITADCPLIDPKILDKIIDFGLGGEYDLFGLAEPFPDGLDCTVISRQALIKSDKMATSLSDREHVCPFIERNKDLFKCGSLSLFKVIMKKDGLLMKKQTLNS